jgi:F-box-like
MHGLHGLIGQPAEILLNVFKYLDGRDLARCRRVSNNLLTVNIAE